MDGLVFLQLPSKAGLGERRERSEAPFSDYQVKLRKKAR